MLLSLLYRRYSHLKILVESIPLQCLCGSSMVLRVWLSEDRLGLIFSVMDSYYGGLNCTASQNYSFMHWSNNMKGMWWEIL